MELRTKKLIRMMLMLLMFVSYSVAFFCGSFAAIYSVMFEAIWDSSGKTIYETKVFADNVSKKMDEAFEYIDIANDNSNFYHEESDGLFTVYDYESYQETARKRDNMISGTTSTPTPYLEMEDSTVKMKYSQCKNHLYTYADYPELLKQTVTDKCLYYKRKYDKQKQRQYDMFLKIKVSSYMNIIDKYAIFGEDRKYYFNSVSKESSNSYYSQNRNSVTNNVSYADVGADREYYENDYGTFCDYIVYSDDFIFSTLYGSFSQFGEYIYIPISNEDELLDEKSLLEREIFTPEKLLMATDKVYTLNLLAQNQIKNFGEVKFWVSTDQEEYGNIETGELVKNRDLYVLIDLKQDKCQVYYEKKKISGVYYRKILEQAKLKFGSDGTICIGVDKGFYNDSIHYYAAEIYKFKKFYIPAIVLAVLGAVMAIMLTIYGIFTSGKTEEECMNFENAIDKIYLELLVGATGIAIIVTLYICYYIFGGVGLDRINLNAILTIIFMAYIVNYWIIEVTIFSIIRRVKKGSLLKDVMFFKTVKLMVHLVRRLFSAISYMINKVRLRDDITTYLYLFIGFVIGTNMLAWILILFLGSRMVFLVFLIFLVWLVLNGTAIYYVNKIVKAQKDIKTGAKKISHGKLFYKIETEDMLKVERDLARIINNIGDGLQKAVGESMLAAEKSVKDERLKAELITNVSHDIKTPLTSIINYIELLKREKIDGEKAKNYLEILEQKSNRLRMLTEDLVEASKITTGNIELVMIPLDFSELVKQAIGEFEDKFMEKELTINSSFTSKSTVIFADGRRTYRIIENLLQNIFKYSMEGTRVYIQLEIVDDQIELYLRNISKAALNIDAKELTERFKRGDSARTTEGSGLGLSIAESLVSMQNGKLQIEIDGDLFKVKVRFPMHNSERKSSSRAYSQEDIPQLNFDEDM